MTALTQSARSAEFLLSEAPGSLSREAVVVASGAGALVPGSVLGRVTKRLAAAPIPTVSGTSPGNGTMTNLAFGPDVQVGTYALACITAASNGGIFSVTAPDGTALPNATVGTAYKTSHLSFLLNDSSQDFTTAARFNVVVTAGGTPAVEGGTGNGAMSAITLGKNAQLGGYRVTLKAAVSHGGDFDVIAPDGSQVGGRFLMGTGDGTAASFASDHINFTLTDDTDFILGNYFNVIVAGYAAPQAKLWDPAAVDGTQEAWGLLVDACNAASAAQDAVVIVRQAEVSAAKLAWKSTVTAAQKPEAYRQLAAAGVIVRS